MALSNAIVGARRTGRLITWTVGGQPLDLTGATITGFKRDIQGITTALDGSLSVTDAESGVFRWTFGENDVAQAGKFMVQFVATFGDGSIEKTEPEEWVVLEGLSVS